MKNKHIKIIPIWDDMNKNALKNKAGELSSKASREQIIKNEFPYIQCVLEQYTGNQNNETEILKVIDFVKMYLEVLGLTQKALANHFEMKYSTLHKYLSEERKLDADLILKISVFTHTRPELWQGVLIKNEVIKLSLEKNNWEAYQKYDYRNLRDKL